MWSEADIAAWEAELRPLSINVTPSLRDAAAHYHAHMLRADVTCPMGCKVVISPGHFFPLVCRSVGNGKSKGWVKSASGLDHAFELIDNGIVDVGDVEGCDYQRVRELPLFFDVISTPHVVAKRDEAKRMYLKRYVTTNLRNRVKVAVTYLVDNTIRPASFYTTDLDVAWLTQNAPEVIWRKW